MVPASIKGKYIIRYTVTSARTTEADIRQDWRIIQETARCVLSKQSSSDEEEENEIPREISRAGQMRRRGLRKRDFSMSLILSNVPMSPKFINGSFAALFDNNDILVEFMKQLSTDDFNGSPIRLSPRRRVRNVGKQMSLDSTFFPEKRSLRLFKPQGSLDSKIEEIFDSSFDSDLPETQDDDIEVEYSANSQETTTISINGKSKAVNGIHSSRVCQHCGHVIKD